MLGVAPFVPWPPIHQILHSLLNDLRNHPRLTSLTSKTKNKKPYYPLDPTDLINVRYFPMISKRKSSKFTHNFAGGGGGGGEGDMSKFKSLPRHRLIFSILEKKVEHFGKRPFLFLFLFFIFLLYIFRFLWSSRYDRWIHRFVCICSNWLVVIHIAFNIYTKVKCMKMNKYIWDVPSPDRNKFRVQPITMIW